MREAYKVAGAVCILSLLAVNVGLEISRTFSVTPTQSVAPGEQGVHAESRTDAEKGPDYLAIATLVVLAFQAAIFYQQTRIMNRHAETTEKMRDVVSEQTAIASRQLTLIGLQTDTLEKQKEIARQSHVATHRPRLAVRNVVIRVEELAWPGRSDLKVGHLVRGHLYVVNKGGYEAEITNALIMIYRTTAQHLPMERPYEGKNGNTGPIATPLLAGQSISIPFNDDGPVNEGQPIRPRLYVMGWIEYRDGGYDAATGTQLTRRTAFCREYELSSQRFVRVKDEDYEHEE